MTTGGDIQRRIIYCVTQTTTASLDKLEAVQDRFRAELELQFGSSVHVEVDHVFEETAIQRHRRLEIPLRRRRT